VARDPRPPERPPANLPSDRPGDPRTSPPRHPALPEGASSLRAQGPALWADPAFRWLVTVAGVSVLLVLGLMIGSTTRDAIPVFQYQGLWEFLTGQQWTAGYSRREFTGTYGAFPFIYGTLKVSLIAMVLALPLAVAVSLYITHLAPTRLKDPLSYTVEMLAAIPSVVYGLWGLLFFVPTFVRPVMELVAETVGSVVPFLGPPVYTVNYLSAGFVLAIMVLPIITAISREVIATCPEDQEHAAYAMGATRWEVMRTIVLPRSMPGIIGGSMLGLGRALGETIAVAMLVGGSQRWAAQLFFAGDAMAAHIANTFQDAAPETVLALIAVGVALFVITIVVNVLARLLVWHMGDITGDAAV
jgi:phosphate transport system permease protein